MRHHLTTVWLQAVVGTLLTAALLQVGSAQVMTSSNFQIQSDSMNVGGGFSSSTNYQQESTVGEVATGDSDSTNYSLRAGYQQMQEVYLSLSAVPDAVLSPAIPGLSGGTANASTSFLVKTDSPSGYSVTLQASTTPALRADAVGDVIDNYTPSGATPDFTFAVSSTQAEFAFTPEGTAVALRYQDSGGVCGVAGSDTESACWDSVTTSAREIVRSAVGNHPNGATTTLRFRVGVGASAGVTAGSYVAPLVVTALPL